MMNERIKKAINALDLRYLINELQFLKGSRVDAIYQNDDELRIRFYVPSFGNYELFANTKRMHLTVHKRAEPLTPSNFAMLLRKYMVGKHVDALEQHKLDRVFEIAINDLSLLVEMFHKGNFVLCDETYTIMMPLNFIRSEERNVVPREKYRYPPTKDVEDYATFKRAFQDDSLAVKILFNMGFAEYSEEIMKSAKIDTTKTGDKITKEEVDRMFEVAEDMMHHDIKASIVYENGEPISVIPFDMKIYSSDKYVLERYDSFNKAMDTYFDKVKDKLEQKKPEEKITKNEGVVPERVLEKEKKIVEKQEEAVEDYKEEEDEKRKRANVIYENYGFVEKILTTLRNARAKHDWNELKEMLKEDDSPEAKAIMDIQESENKVILNINGEKAELFLNKTTEENANYYYEYAKKMKRKTEGAITEIEKRKEKISNLEEEISPIYSAEKETATKDTDAEEDGTVEEMKAGSGDDDKKEEKKRSRWYHKYRYFWSIEGLLVVAGKDDTTNEELIKKHVEPDDIVLHADIHGAPFVVIKQRRDKREKAEDVTPQGVVEAAEFAASYSKAWQMGLGSVEVYWVKPDQVTKTTEPGQFLPKGSFVIRGQRNYLKSIKLRLGVGVDVENKYFIVGPLKSVAARCDYYVTIVPGETPAPELARNIKDILADKALYPDEKELITSLPMEQIEARIPSAKGSIMDKVESGLL